MSVQRPLSPHLQVYRPQLTSSMSILHRITGLILCLGAIALMSWILMLAAGPECHVAFHRFAHGFGGKLVLAVSVFALCYHLGNGIRHLFWDMGKGFDLKSVHASGYAAIAFAVAMTAIVLYRVGGAS